jgi:hypothetical protein
MPEARVKRTLTATAASGRKATRRTAAEYNWAAIRDDGETVEIVACGWSNTSVRSRAHTKLGHYSFEVVSFKAEVEGVDESTVPAEMREHFDRKREMSGSPTQRRRVPQIVERFVPGKGWLQCTTFVPATFAELRRLQAAGATTVGVVAYGSPVADFPVEPILRRAGLPLLGGSLIGSKTKVR